MGMIAIEQMEFWAYHGCFEEEQIIGTRFLVDLYIQTDTTAAEASDSLHDTLNYLSVYKVVKSCMESPSKLLEHVARRILQDLHARFPAILHARVKVAKMNPPLGGKIGSVSLTLESGE